MGSTFQAQALPLAQAAAPVVVASAADTIQGPFKMAEAPVAGSFSIKKEGGRQVLSFSSDFKTNEKAPDLKVIFSPSKTPLASTKAPGFPLMNTLKLSRLRQTLGMRGTAQNPNLIPLRDALREGKRAVGAWGGRLYFMYLPTALGVTSDRPPSWYATREEVLAIAREEGLEVIDLYPEFR
ncbi:MAG: DM13 domain-containing protein, partial [Synechococcus sp. ELA619]